jgi:hypothetical protein
MKLKLKIDYLVISFVFIFSRILFLFFTPYSFYNEEAKIGSIGHDLIFKHKLLLPFWGYLDSPHSGGSLFSGLIATPFYLIFGDRYLALKATALVLSMLTVFIWYRLISTELREQKRFFIPFLLFFTFATPHYVQKSVILAGNTVELMFFNALIIYYFWRIKNNTSGVYRPYFFLGILCGFSFWVQFMSFYLFFTIIITILFLGRFKMQIYRIVFLVVGFILGALPLWIYNFNYRWATLTTYMNSSVGVSLDGHKLGKLLFFDLPASFHFLNMGIIKAQHLSYLLFGIMVLIAIVYLITETITLMSKKVVNPLGKNREIRLGFFLILYLLIFIILTSISSFPVGSNGANGFNSMNVHAEYYIVSLQPIIFILLIFSLNKFKNKIATAMYVLIAVIFIFSYFNLFTSHYYNDSLFHPMHRTEANAYECGFHFVKNPKLFLEFKQRIPVQFQEEYLKGAKDARSGPKI